MNQPDMKREALKCYLALLWSEGHLKGLRSPAAIAQRVAMLVGQNALEALGEIGLTVADQAVDHGADWLAGLFKRKFSGVVSDLKRRGFDSVWGDIKRNALRRK